MKQLKRFLALVLVGVLALTVLTGCGGTNSLSEQMEKQIVAGINNARSDNAVPLTNDSDLQARCVYALKSIGSDGQIYLKDTITSSLVSGTPAKLIMVAVETEPSYKYDYVKLHPDLKVNAKVFTANDLGDATPTIKTEADQAFYDSITRVGVATRTIDGKIYLAMAMEVPL